MMQGLFGVRMGPRFEHVGVFGKIRPGFIYYDKAMPGGGNPNPTSLTRFAWDVGGIVEVYPRRESKLNASLRLRHYAGSLPHRPQRHPLHRNRRSGLQPVLHDARELPVLHRIRVPVLKGRGFSRAGESPSFLSLTS